MPRRELAVPFYEKDEAKRLGARWDAEKKVWFLPEGVDASPFQKWLISALKANGQPSDIPTIRSKGFYIAENVDCRRCWKCKEGTTVCAILLPAGHERLNIDGGKIHGQWEKVDYDTCLAMVTYLNQNAVRAMGELNPDYKIAFHHGYYWLNHCEECGVLLADWYDHDEPGGAFWPTTASEANRINLIFHNEEFEGNAECFGNSIPFIKVPPTK